jgi:hypothetical protein
MFEFVVAQFNALIKPLQELAKDKRELKDNALRSVSHALNETRIYYKSLERGTDRNLEIEAQLAKYWSAAAIPLRHIDPDLAMTCQLKCDYWIAPDRWSEDDLKNNGIALDTLHKAYRRMLVPSSVARRPGVDI